MTFLLPLTVLCTGVACFLVTLWFTRFGALESATGNRLARLRSESEGGAGSVLASSLLESVLKRKGKTDAQSSFFAKHAAAWEHDLDRAGVTLNVREYLVVRIGVGLGIVAALLLVVPIQALAVLGFPVGFFVVGRWVKGRVKSRRRKLDSQLIDVLQSMASSLRAGFGLLQALESAAEQSTAPLSIELRRTLRDIAVGSSVEQALGALNDRVGSSDFDIVISAVLIQRSVGGNLAEILDNVAATMRERERIRSEIRTLTSQQRLTGYVIGAVPIGLLIIFTIINPGFVGLLFSTQTGNIFLVAGAIMEVIGFLVIRKIVDIEI